MSDIKFKKIQYGPELEFEYSIVYRTLKDLPSGIVKANPAENSGEVIDINFGGLTAPGMATPVLNTDGANKSYVDSITYDVVRASNVLTTDYLLLGSNNDEYLVASTHLHVTNSGTNLNAGSFNDVVLDATGSATLFLNASGHYTTPTGGGNVNTAVTLALNYLLVGNDSHDVKITPSIYADATGAKLYAESFNDVTLDATGSAGSYLNAAGTYTIPPSGGNVGTSVTLTNNYMVLGSSGTDIDVAASIYADATGAKLYADMFNDVALIATGSATLFLNAAGQYSVPSGSGTGNVNTSVTLTNNYMVLGSSGTDIDVAASIYTDATGAKLYADMFNDVALIATGNATLFLNAAGQYSVPSGSGTGNVNTSVTLTDNYMVLGADTENVKISTSIYADATGANLYADMFNDVALIATGSATLFLNASGQYSVPSGSGTGNVNTSVTLTDNYMVLGADTEDVKISTSIYADATGANLYADMFNDVALIATGSATLFLNASGVYTTVGNVSTAVTLTDNYMVLGADTEDVKISTSIYADATGAKLYADMFNDVALIATGSATLFLNASGHYTTPTGGGNVTTSVTLALNYLLVGNDSHDVKITPSIYTDATGAKLYAESFNDVTLDAAGTDEYFLTQSGSYVVFPGVLAENELSAQTLLVGTGDKTCKSESGVTVSYIESGSITSIADETALTVKVFATNVGTLVNGQVIILYGMSDPHYDGEFVVTINDATSFFIVNTFTTTATGLWTDLINDKNLKALMVNGVALTDQGSINEFLNAAGTYTIPPSGGNVNTSVTLTDNYMVLGADTEDVKISTSIYADATGANLYADMFNDVALIATGSATLFLNASGQYSVPSGSGTGNVNTSVTLTDNYMVLGADTEDVKISTSIYADATGANLYADMFNDVALIATGSATLFLNASGQYSVPSGSGTGNVNADNPLSLNYLVVGTGSDGIKTTSILTNYVDSYAITSIEPAGATQLKIITSTDGVVPTDFITLTNMTDPHYNGNYTVHAVDSSGMFVTGTFTTTATGEWYKGIAQSNIEAYSFNDVALDATGSDTLFLNAAGGYSVPSGIAPGNVNTLGTLTNDYMIIGSGGTNVDVAASIYADAAGAKLYADMFNDVALIATGSDTLFLSSAGIYRSAIIQGLTIENLVSGAITSITQHGNDQIHVVAPSASTVLRGDTIVFEGMSDGRYDGSYVVAEIYAPTGFRVYSSYYGNATGTWVETIDVPSHSVTSITYHSEGILNINTDDSTGAYAGTRIVLVNMSNTEYNRTYEVESVHSATQFKIKAAYLGTAHGHWERIITGVNIVASQFNSIELTTSGSPNDYLNAAGQYSVPSGGGGAGNVTTSVTLTDNYMVLGADTEDVKISTSIYADATGAKLYADMFNDVALIATGNATLFLNAAGQYSVPSGSGTGNVTTSGTLTVDYVIFGNNTTDVKTHTQIYSSSTGGVLYASGLHVTHCTSNTYIGDSYNGVGLVTSGSPNAYLNATGQYSVPGPLEPGSIFIALKNCKYDHAVNLETDTGKVIEDNEFINVVPNWQDLGLPKLSEHLTYFMRA